MSGCPLLCELHAHSTWSDGDLSVSELVDLYGSHEFDVLCVTDHVGRGGEWHDPRWRITGPDAHAEYLAEIQREAWRAEVEYGLLLVPGLELTYDDHDPVEAALVEARGAGAALIAAHPYPPGAATAARSTTRWAVAGHSLSGLVDRYELVNRRDVFSWVAEAGLPGVASGDFHRHEHLLTWKTLLPCAAGEGAVVRYLRSALPAYLVDLAEPARTQAA